jgi:transcriptional regulator with XRE-family HTH domain
MPKSVPPDPAFAAAIRQLRHQAGLSQEDLAFASGLTIASVSRVECAVTNPTWRTVRSLTNALDIDLHQLATTIEAEPHKDTNGVSPQVSNTDAHETASE